MRYGENAIIMVTGLVEGSFIDNDLNLEAIEGIAFEARWSHRDADGDGFEIEGAHLRSVLCRFRKPEFDRLRQPASNEDWRKFTDHTAFFIPKNCCEVVAVTKAGPVGRQARMRIAS